MVRLKGFIGGSYDLSDRGSDCQRCINLLPVLNENQTEANGELGYLQGTPGLLLLASLPTSPVRGVYTASSGNVYVVAGNALYLFNSNNTFTSLGTLFSNTGNVSMADNGFQLIIVDGTYGYIYNWNTSKYINITDTNFLGSNTVVYMNSVFVCAKPNSNIFFYSNLLDGTTWSTTVTPVQQIERIRNDYIQSLVILNSYLFIASTQSLEMWTYTGNISGSPGVFSIYPGTTTEHGVVSPNAIAQLDNTLFWVSQSKNGAGMVYKLIYGSMPIRISNYAIEEEILTYGNLSGTTTWTYQEQGHNFFCINFPNSNTTWVYDSALSKWHERACFNQGIQSRHLVNNHCYGYSKHIVGDYSSGNIYQLDPGTYTDNGQTITRIRTSPHINEDIHRAFYNSLEVELMTGEALGGSVNGSNPQISLAYSDDYGYTYKPDRTKSMGLLGKYFYRCIWRRLGSARDRVFRITITEPIPIAIYGVEIDVVPGKN